MLRRLPDEPGTQFTPVDVSMRFQPGLKNGDRRILPDELARQRFDLAPASEFECMKMRLEQPFVGRRPA